METILKKYDTQLIAKASKIKALIFDVDGVLTDGGIIYTNSGDELKQFNVKDGQIIKHLKNNNIIVGAITGRDSALVARRCEELKLDFVYQKAKDKYSVYQQILNDYKLTSSEVAYIGDDVIDMKVIREVGLGVTPADAIEYVKEYADMVALNNGGHGVVRETADLILAAQGLLNDVIESYLES